MLNVVILRQPLYGTVVWNGYEFIYTPSSIVDKNDYYIYQQTENGVTTTHINYVNAANTAPITSNLSLTADAFSVNSFSLGDLVSDNTNPFNELYFTEVKGAQRGNAYTDGNFIYYKSYSYNCVETLTYYVTDKQFTATGTITLSVINGIEFKGPQKLVRNRFGDLISLMNDVSLASAHWETTYSILTTDGVNWLLVDPVRFDQVSTEVENNSASWIKVHNSEAEYDDFITTFSANSSRWSANQTSINGFSSLFVNWNTEHALVTANQTQWDSAETILSDISGHLNTIISDFSDLFTTAQNNSSIWAGTGVLSQSAFWNSLNNGNISDWNNDVLLTSSLSVEYFNDKPLFDSTNDTVSGNLAYWDSDNSNSILTANSAGWVNVFNSKLDYDSFVSTLSSNSATWIGDKTLIDNISSFFDNWNTGYDVLTSNETNWNSANSLLSSLSSDLVKIITDSNSLVTTVNTNSSFWHVVDVLALSANWMELNTSNISGWNTLLTLTTAFSSEYIKDKPLYDSTYNTVSSNLSSWLSDNSYSILLANSASWDAVYNKKPDYDSLVSTLSSNSASWVGNPSVVSALTSISSVKQYEWNDVYNTVNSNKISWDSSLSTLDALSSSIHSDGARYDEINTLTNLSSVYWNGDFIDLILSSYTYLWDGFYDLLISDFKQDYWDTSYTLTTAFSSEFYNEYNILNSFVNYVNSNSAFWDLITIQSLLSSNSGNWESVYNTLTTLSSNWIGNFNPNWTEAYNTLSANSGYWNPVLSIVQNNSATWLGGSSILSSMSADYLTGGSIYDLSARDLLVYGDAHIKLNLTVQGSSFKINTNLYLTSSFDIENDGTTDALVIDKSGFGPIAKFEILSSDILEVYQNAVTINTVNVGETLTVLGNISATGNIYPCQDGIIYYTSNSAKYDSTYTYLTANSSTISSFVSAAPKYNASTSYVQNNSANIFDLTHSISAYDSFYSIVKSQSGYTSVVNNYITLSGSRFGYDPSFRAKQTNYDNLVTYVHNNSAATLSAFEISHLFSYDTIRSGISAMYVVQDNVQIIEWSIFSDVPTVASVDVLSSSFNYYPNGNSLVGSNIPHLDGVNPVKHMETNLVQWTNTVLNKDSFVIFNLTNNTAASSVLISLKVKKV